MPFQLFRPLLLLISHCWTTLIQMVPLSKNLFFRPEQQNKTSFSSSVGVTDVFLCCPTLPSISLCRANEKNSKCIHHMANGPRDVGTLWTGLLSSAWEGTVKSVYIKLLALLTRLFPSWVRPLLLRSSEITPSRLLYLVLFRTSLQNEIIAADKQPLRTLACCSHSYSVSNQTWIYLLHVSAPW